jgi:7-cyano-7-deazaguanine synthase
MAENPAKAVVLLSGGLDSPTVVAMAIDQDFEVYSLSFSYGQRHTTELDAAKVIAAQFGLNRHVIVDIDLRRFGGSALTDDIEVPKGRDTEQMAGEILVTYVPCTQYYFPVVRTSLGRSAGSRTYIYWCQCG